MPKTLVTGATAGIGFETARELARRGHEVLVHGRSEASASRAVAALRADDPSAVLVPVWADLASLDAVRQLGESLGAEGLDRVVHNAGVVMPSATRTVDGFETTWAVNHLAPFLLTSLLLDGLLARAEARVITVSSSGHRAGRIHFDDVNLEGRYDHIVAYCQTKLANVLFTEELARRTAGTTLVAHALDPGVVRTGLLDRTGFGNQPAQSPADGARTSVFLATDPSVAGFSGGYFVDTKRVAAVRTDPAVAARLWALSETQTGSSMLERRPPNG